MAVPLPSSLTIIKKLDRRLLTFGLRELDSMQMMHSCTIRSKRNKPPALTKGRFNLNFDYEHRVHSSPEGVRVRVKKRNRHSLGRSPSLSIDCLFYFQQ
jgi:hypothetical protein